MFIGISTNKCLDITPKKIVKKDNPFFSFFYFKKLLFFLITERAKAVEKIRAMLLEMKLVKDQRLLICKFDIEQEGYVGIGRQLYTSNYKKFNKELVFKIRKDCPLALKDLKLTEPLVFKIFKYLPVEEACLEKNIPQEILKLNPKLKKIGTLPSHFRWRPLKRIVKSRGKLFIFGYGKYVRAYIKRFFENDINSIIEYNIKLWDQSSAYSFYQSWNDALEAFKQIDNPKGIIATYHSTHNIIAKSLFAVNPNCKVFVEKPLAVNFEDALELIKLKRRGFWLDAGFNRRYILWNNYIKKIISFPVIIDVIVKELKIPKWHWYFWKTQGTRITGNICHWIDLGYFWIKDKPEEIFLNSNGDDYSISIRFQNGSILNISASDKGSDLAGVQEWITIRFHNSTIKINDYRELIIESHSGRKKKKKKIKRDKGHDAMYRRLYTAFNSDLQPLYKNDDIFWTSYLTSECAKMERGNIRYLRVPDEVFNLAKELL